jgi:putative SOS response-associated peptidase YedK
LRICNCGRGGSAETWIRRRNEKKGRNRRGFIARVKRVSRGESFRKKFSEARCLIMMDAEAGISEKAEDDRNDLRVR